jgi:hypothetical protein
LDGAKIRDIVAKISANAKTVSTVAMLWDTARGVPPEGRETPVWRGRPGDTRARARPRPSAT